MKYYIHIPFCGSKCAYCDFFSTPGKNDRKRLFVEALDKEIESRVGSPEDVETLYLGGGTPSSLSAGMLGHIISPFLNGDQLQELTVEVNPEDVDAGFADFLRSVSPKIRVSMGIQSLDDTQLSFIGRRHTASGAVNAYRILRDAGISNISLDLIYGLPGQDLDYWKDTLVRLLTLRPEHLSAYLLSYEPKTRLGVMLSKGKVMEASGELAMEMYRYLCDTSRKAGYEHYEISNFARPGFRAMHNSSYWDGSEYIGFGPGAHSFVGGVRGFNHPSLKDYIATAGCGVYEEEQEDEMSSFNDRIITGLRTSEGIPMSILDRYPQAYHEADSLIARGLLKLKDNGCLVIPEHLWLKSDAIMRDLIVVEDF